MEYALRMADVVVRPGEVPVKVYPRALYGSVSGSTPADNRPADIVDAPLGVVPFSASHNCWLAPQSPALTLLTAMVRDLAQFLSKFATYSGVLIV